MPAERMSARCDLTVTPSLRHELENGAAAAGLTFSAFCRLALAIGAPVVVQAVAHGADTEDEAALLQLAAAGVQGVAGPDEGLAS